jgi:tetrahydromethanopterin S-methyltransferase subunit G
MIWSATIDDQTASFFIQFNRNLDQVDQKSQQAFQGVERHSKASGAEIGILAGIVGGLTSKLLEMGMQAVQQLKAFAEGVIQVGSRAETLAVALSVVGKNAGYSRDELKGFEEGVKAQGITTNAARTILMQMAQANLDLSKASELARVAQDAAVMANINSSDATERLIHGITTLNPLILRQMNIIVNSEAEYKKFTGGVKGASDALATEQKQAIFLNAALESGKKIFGTYEAAMGTAGKQANSMARFIEELKLELWVVAQPAYSEWIKMQTQFYKDMLKWVVANKDALKEFGLFLLWIIKVVAEVVRFALKFDPLIRALIDIPILAVKAGTAIASIGVGTEEANKRAQDLGTTWKQTQFLIVRGANVISEVVKGTFVWLDELLKAWAKTHPELVGRQTVENQVAWLKALDESGKSWQTIGERASAAASQTALEWGKVHGIIADVGDESEDTAAKMDKIADQTKAATDKIMELNAKYKEELEDIRIKREREEIDDEIRRSRRIEDLERDHIKRLEQIQRNAAEQRTKLLNDLAKDEHKLLADQQEERLDFEKEKAEERIQIEEDYQQTLQDIQYNYERDVQEAARSNDAVAVARLMRQRARNIQDAARDRDKDIKEQEKGADKDRKAMIEEQEKKRKELGDQAAERLKDLQENLQKELDEAERSRKEGYEQLKIDLAREEEDKILSRARDSEDMARKHKADLEALGTFLAQQELVDQATITKLLEQHGQYITDDLALWESYYSQRLELALAASSAPGVIPRVPYSSGGRTDYEGPSVSPGGSPWLESWQAEGGIGLATSPTNVHIAERGIPEIIAAVPLSAAVTYNHNINMRGEIGVSGVTPQTEGEMKGAVMAILTQFGNKLLSRRGATYG